MNNVLTERIPIGISACMFGCPVRYNKKGWNTANYLEREFNNFSWNPVCPECMAGLGVPRNPIRLVGGNGFDVWEGKAFVKNRQGRDVTNEIKRGANVCLDTLKTAGISAFVFMEGSPSCGVYRTTLKNKRLGSPPGVFGALLIQEGFFLIPAVDLQSPIKRWDWLRRLYAFIWLKDAEINNKNDLYKTWHILKFLCQEISRKDADIIGKDMASLSKKIDRETIEGFRRRVLELLRRPSTVPKIKQMLWKNYSYYRKKYNLSVDFVNPPNTLRNMNSLVKELTLLERKLIEEGKFSSSSPIVFKPTRK